MLAEAKGLAVTWVTRTLSLSLGIIWEMGEGIPGPHVATPNTARCDPLAIGAEKRVRNPPSANSAGHRQNSAARFVHSSRP